MPEAAARPTAPNPLWLLLEAPRLVLESATLAPSVPVLWRAPRGDGHPVMVLPGFWAGDQSTCCASICADWATGPTAGCWAGTRAFPREPPGSSWIA